MSRILSRVLKLTLTPGGGAELTQGGRPVWTSVNDESFRDEFPDELLDEDDIESILDYLVSDDVITESEADHVECEQESLDGDDEDEDDEDDEDDDDDDENEYRARLQHREYYP
jgi:hypothetical protein